MTTTLQHPAGPPAGPPPGPPSRGPEPNPGPAAAPQRPTRGQQDQALHSVDALIGAVALAVGTSAVATTMDGSGWLAPTLEVIAVVYLVGLGCRLIRIPAWVSVPLQLIGLLLTLTSLFTVGAVGGILPTTSTFGEAGQLLSGAWHQIEVTAPPAPVTPELSFLIAAAVGLAALIVDYLITQARSPALVALPLLCLYSVPASIIDTMLPWYTFAAPAVMYGLLLAASGHTDERIGRRAGFDLARAGATILVLATVAAVFLAGMVTAVGTAGRLPKTGGAAGQQIGLSPFTTMLGSLKETTPIDLLTVDGLTQPSYLRTVALTTWTPNQGWSLGALQGTGSVQSDAQLPGVPATAGSTQTVTINSQAFRDRFLPILYGTQSIGGIDDGWSYDADLSTVFRTTPDNAGTYQLTVPTSEPTAAELEKDTVTGGGALTDVGNTPAMVASLARQVTADSPTAFDKAKALVDYFTNPDNGFVYSLSVPTGNSGDALVDFLTNKQGYCEQYASAMAVMLRTLGIPARVAIGFTQGTQQPDGSYLITSHDAHAWVEVRFDKAGWVRFDPTPLADGQGGEQGWSDTGGATEPTTAAPTPTAAAPTQTRRIDRGTEPDQQTTAGAATQTPRGPTGLAAVPVAVWWLLGVLIVVGAAVAAPSTWRRTRRNRRLGTIRAGSPGAATAAWSEIEDLAIDHAFPLRREESARTTANRLARAAHLGEHARDGLRALVVAAEHEWYAPPGGTDAASPVRADGGVRAAHSATVMEAVTGRDQLIDAIDSVAVGLAGSAPLGLWDRLWPRSVRPWGTTSD